MEKLVAATFQNTCRTSETGKAATETFRTKKWGKRRDRHGSSHARKRNLPSKAEVHKFSKNLIAILESRSQKNDKKHEDLQVIGATVNNLVSYDLAIGI
jgi:hypothetical protein